uniref:hypothetical protein n=1 Tax=Methylobacterium sp. B34 TaxID=95563 RepID=UPI000349E444|nr:hypothetical protein [Methylobacterium sp. B34]
MFPLPTRFAAILTPGQRTVTSVLHIMGCAQERRFVNVHRFSSAAASSSLPDPAKVRENRDAEGGSLCRFCIAMGITVG